MSRSSSEAQAGYRIFRKARILAASKWALLEAHSFARELLAGPPSLNLRRIDKLWLIVKEALIVVACSWV
jgi:hypothetical protein